MKDFLFWCQNHGCIGCLHSTNNLTDGSCYHALDGQGVTCAVCSRFYTMDMVNLLNTLPHSKHEYVLSILPSSVRGKGNEAKGEVIAVNRGERTYTPTTWGIQSRAWVNETNKGLGITSIEAETYSTCSIFNNWRGFNNVYQAFETLEKQAGT